MNHSTQAALGKGWTVATLVIGVASPLPAPAQNAATFRELNRCGVAVVLPSALPGFRLTSFKTSICARSCRFSNIPCRQAFANYSARHEGPNRCHYTISGDVGGGYGEAPPPREWSTRTKLLGTVTISESFDRSYLTGLSTAWHRKEPDSEWVRTYHNRFPHTNFNFHFECAHRQFDPNKALMVVRSLRVVAAD